MPRSDYLLPHLTPGEQALARDTADPKVAFLLQTLSRESGADQEGGGYNDLATDKAGGPTRYGITGSALTEHAWRNYRKLRAEGKAATGPYTHEVTIRDADDNARTHRFVSDVPDHPQDVTRDLAETIYIEDYWYGTDADRIADVSEKVALAVASYGVNAGQATAKKTLQRVLGFAGDDVDADLAMIQGVRAQNPGYRGHTMQRLDRYVAEHGEDALLNAFQGEVLEKYTQLAKDNPEKYGGNLGGWVNRLNETSQFVASRPPYTGTVLDPPVQVAAATPASPTNNDSLNLRPISRRN